MRSLFIVASIAFALAGCKHDDGIVGTATIHSGTPDGPRVTNMEPERGATASTGIKVELGDRLARAFCKHDQECAMGEPETRLLQEDACFAEARYGARASLEQWPCDPAGARDGFDECLAAIRSADCTAQIGEAAQIRACQASEICRRSNVAR